MISFKDIELSDRELIIRYTQNSPRRNCDLSFSNLCSWRFLYNTQFAILDGYLLLKFWAEEELVYMMPIGNGDLKKVLEALIEDAHQEGKPFCLLGICSGMCSELETFMPGKFKPSGTTSTNSSALATTSIPLSHPTAFRNVWSWKPSGAKPTIATNMREQATNAVHWSMHFITLMNWD